jgi:glycosyltransferase involved in cell wall biosynthesis
VGNHYPQLRVRRRTALNLAEDHRLEVRVLIVAENASLKFGGEAALPVHYYRILRQRNVPTWLVVHARTRDELSALFPDDQQRIFYVADSLSHRILWRLSKRLPRRLANFTIEFIMRLMTQSAQRKMIRRLVRTHQVSVIHQPIPVSPNEPSMIFGMGVPVIIGPMNGGMDYPPAFRKLQSLPERVALYAFRRLSNALNRLMPGKRKAALLLVANDRTRAALPDGVCARVVTIVENGVDLSLWKGSNRPDDRSFSHAIRFVFVGRLVEWKAVDILLTAFKKAAIEAPMSLSIIGDGVERAALEKLTADIGSLGQGENEPGKVRFYGWMSQAECAERLRECDALVLPSLRECGGAVVLEAMAMELPVIATAWGGPADYLDPSCGILVEPTSREAFVDGLRLALVRLAKQPEERMAMGKAARSKVLQEFDWNAKVNSVFELYRDVIEHPTNYAG